MARIHPKTKGTYVGGTLATALVVLAQSVGVHLTSAEGAAIATLVAFALSYLRPPA